MDVYCQKKTSESSNPFKRVWRASIVCFLCFCVKSVLIVILTVKYEGQFDNETYALYLIAAEVIPLVVMLIIFEGTKKEGHSRPQQVSAMPSVKELISPTDESQPWAPSPSYHALAQAHNNHPNYYTEPGDSLTHDSSYCYDPNDPPSRDTTSTPYSYYYDDEPRTAIFPTLPPQAPPKKQGRPLAAIGLLQHHGDEGGPEHTTAEYYSLVSAGGDRY